MSDPYKMSQNSFIDAFWSQLEAAVGPHAEKRLAAFVSQHGVRKWIIATDFCIRDKDRPNDSFAFVVFPAGERLAEVQKQLLRLPARDLKDVKKIPESIIRFFKSGRVFTFCFAADRVRRLFLDPDAARRSIDDTISMIKNWKNADACQKIIADVCSMRAEANKKNLNTRLLEDIIITVAIVSYIAVLLHKYSAAENIGWSPDRDKITESYRGIASTLFAINVSALCQNLKLSEPKLSFFIQDSGELWCDPYIRLADYAAGATAAWDPPTHDAVPPKIACLIRSAFADNRYLFFFRVAFYTQEKQCFVEIRRVAVRVQTHNQ